MIIQLLIDELLMLWEKSVVAYWMFCLVICVDGLRKTRNTRYITMWVWVEIGTDKLQTGSLMLNVYLLTPWSRVLLQKLTGPEANQESFPIFGTRNFIPVHTSARHLSLC
jgi:hypothetical protein